MVKSKKKKIQFPRIDFFFFFKCNQLTNYVGGEEGNFQPIFNMFTSNLRLFATNYPHPSSSHPRERDFHPLCTCHRPRNRNFNQPTMEVAQLGIVLALDTHADHVLLVRRVVVGLVHGSILTDDAPLIE